MQERGTYQSTAFAAFSGGATAHLVGADPLEGATWAAIGHMFNFLGHDGKEGDGEDESLRKVGLGLYGINTYSTAKGLYYYDEYGGTWRGKNGLKYGMEWGGNGSTGGKYKYALNKAKPFRGIGKFTSRLGIGLSVYDLYSNWVYYNGGQKFWAFMDIGVGVGSLNGGWYGRVAGATYFGIRYISTTSYNSNVSPRLGFDVPGANGQYYPRVDNTLVNKKYFK